MSDSPASASGTFALGGDLPVTRLGYGAMRITGPGIWGQPSDPDEARRVLRRAVELGVDFVDTATAPPRTPAPHTPRRHQKRGR